MCNFSWCFTVFIKWNMGWNCSIFCVNVKKKDPVFILSIQYLLLFCLFLIKRGLIVAVRKWGCGTGQCLRAFSSLHSKPGREWVEVLEGNDGRRWQWSANLSWIIFWTFWEPRQKAMTKKLHCFIMLYQRETFLIMLWDKFLVTLLHLEILKSPVDNEFYNWHRSFLYVTALSTRKNWS